MNVIVMVIEGKHKTFSGERGKYHNKGLMECYFLHL